MAEERVRRRLAAILAADVVGFSRLMEADETGTLTALKARRRTVLEPLVARHRGRVFKVIGDGVLVEFASAVDAVQCAVDLQQGFADLNSASPGNQPILLRIGVNLGDVIVEGGDLYGDGVNIAARLETLAEPGGIVVSGTAFDHIKSKVKVGFEDLGEQALKNIAVPVRAYRTRDPAAAAAARPVPAVSDKPSIAVLAFQNMSGDPAQEYFADGVVEEIITGLSRISWLFVIARNSSFSYKGRAVDVKQIGRELGVRYVLEGSIRRAGDKLRIAAQLIDTATGAHLWAQRYDGGLAEVFDLQDEVTASVVGAITPKLQLAEIERARRKPTTSLDAYDHYLRGLAAVRLWTREDNSEALRQFYRAIEIDPNYAAAYGMASRTFAQRKAGQMADLATQDVAEAARLARIAADLGRNDDTALATAAITLGYVAADLKTGVALTERALALNPNLAYAWYVDSWMRTWLGQTEKAVASAHRAMRLSPQDPEMFQLQAAMAHALFTAGHFEEALSWADRSLSDRQQHLPALLVAAASLALLGRLPEARGRVERILQLNPGMSMQDLQQRYLPHHQAQVSGLWSRALGLAGLQE
jgi:TolB-like protein